MLASFKKKYALSDQGMKIVVLGTLWTTLTNLIIMAGTASLLLVMNAFVEHLTAGAPLPEILPYLAGLLLFALILFGSSWFQYSYSYGAVFSQTGTQRIDLAERLRKLPFSFFGRRDLADLTDTILGGVCRWPSPSSLPLGDSSKPRRSVQDRPRFGSVTAFRRRLTAFGRFTPPIRRTGIWRGSSRPSMTPKPLQSELR